MGAGMLAMYRAGKAFWASDIVAMESTGVISSYYDKYQE